MPTDPNAAFAAWREREGLLSDADAAAKLGCPRGTVWKWKTGKSTVPASILRACAAVSYDLPPYERILTGEGMKAWMAERGLSATEGAAALGISRSSALNYGKIVPASKTPIYVALAAAAVNADIPPINHEPGDAFVRYPKIDPADIEMTVRSRRGLARARALSPERRSEIARKASRARWSKGEGSPPA